MYGWASLLVRHKKYRKRSGSNELSVRLMDRIAEIASDEGDLVFDPFGGSGTTYNVDRIQRIKSTATKALDLV